MIINLNKPLKKDATYEQAYERFKVVMGGDELVKSWKPAIQPYLSYLGIRKKIIPNTIIVWLGNDEIIFYTFNVEKGDSNNAT